MKCKSFIFIFVLSLLSSVTVFADDLTNRSQKRDTLLLCVLFRSGNGTEVEPDYSGNRRRLDEFGARLSEVLSDGGKVSGVRVMTSSSPEGSFTLNMKLSTERGAAVVDYLAERFSISKDIMSYESLGEDWKGFADAVRDMNAPWRDDVLAIIQDKGLEDGWVNDEESKMALKRLDDGHVWGELKRKVFPLLRAARCDTYIIVDMPEDNPSAGYPAGAGNVQEPGVSPQTKVDTVYFDRIVEIPVRKKTKPLDLGNKKMIFAVKTNILAVPFANVGVSVPLGEHWSIGGNWYYPWIWRNDYHKDCFEFLAGDFEVRYWFRSKRLQKEQRLTGVSIGLYGAMGHYDFERNWSGYQGKYYNAGVDLLYSVPVWGGRMHLEFELGIGYIWSLAQPYECLEPYGDCFRIVDKNRLVRWIGPTRAQVSIVVPIYVKTKKGGAK